MQKDSPFYKAHVHCKACGKDTGITAGELYDKTSFDCPHCKALIKRTNHQGETNLRYTKTKIVLHPESDTEILCDRCKEVLQITNPICPMLVVATVLSPGNVMYSAAYCKGLECAIWDKQRRCCGLIQK